MAWPKLQTEHSILIFDRKLDSIAPGFRAWSRRFSERYAVTAGESLKSAESFAQHLERLDRKIGPWPARKISVVAAGGGSVGDFAGFFASVYRRGVRLIHIPSTWLAAVDSAHGGKTALNLGSAKNQIGTFYPAAETHLVREILLAQPKARACEAMSEVCKVALLDGRPWARRLMRCSGAHTDERDLSALLWAVLPQAIDAKLRIVERDPFERTGYRRILNLGHTMAHVLELRSRLPHGAAVGCGLRFALAFSAQKGLLPPAQAESWSQRLDELGVEKMSRRRLLTPQDLARLIQRDKKRTGAGVDFVFLCGIGKPKIERITVESVIDEASRQGWLK